MNELWRVQGQTGAVRMMSLDDIDRAFNAGYLHAGTNVLAPGSLQWQTLGEAAGLDEVVEQTPSLSPMAISDGPASYQLPYIPQHAALADDSFAPPKSRKGLVFGFFVAAAAAACAFALVTGNVASTQHSTMTVGAAPLAAETSLPPAVVTALEQPKAADAPKGLSEETRQRLLDADKANKKKSGKGKHRLVRTQDENDGSQPIPKTDGKPLVESGDKFDPLNGSL